MAEALKEKLKVQLLVKDIVVAESEDATLWQKVLAAITAKESRDMGAKAALPPSKEPADDIGLSELEYDQKVANFARELGVSVEFVVGACRPETESPYIHLDHRCWEALKKNTPKRGPGSVGPLPFALTVLALWFKVAGLGSPTKANGREVLRALGLTDPNPTRGIKNTEWLQLRGGEVLLNPASISKATNVVRAYCLKQKLKDVT